MAYINLDPAYFTNLKTIRLIARLGPGAEILPIKLWCHCAAHHAKDGALLNYDQAVLEALLGVKCVDALIEVGFLEKVENGYQCCNWLEHQGHLAAFRERAERGAKARWNKARLLKRGGSNAKRDNKQCSKQSPIPNHTVPTSLTTLAAGAAQKVSYEIPDDLAHQREPIEAWLAYKRERGQAYKPRGFAVLLKKCRELGNELSRAVEFSISSNYAGLFAPAGAWRGKTPDRKVSEKYVGDDSRY